MGWLNETRRTPHQSGKISIEDEKIECLFVTLDKAEGYHDRISYHDYAISPELFQAAYCALGPVTKTHIEGDRPMSLHWKLEVPLPMELYRAFSVLRG